MAKRTQDLLQRCSGIGAVCWFVGLLGCGHDVRPSLEGPAILTPAVAPPIIGGTLLVTRDDRWVVAADPDRDAVWVADALSRTAWARVNLEGGSEPGRLVEDGDGKVHVALRRGGKVAVINPHTGALEASRPVCPAPRGLAYDAATDDLHVACATGELVTMKARSGEVERTVRLGDDLRDVVLSGDHLVVSRFRSPELIELDGSGLFVSAVKPRTLVLDDLDMAGRPLLSVPTAAWRTIAMPNGQVVVLHQRSLAGAGSVSTKPGGYRGGGGCGKGAIVMQTITLFQRDASGALAFKGDAFIPSLTLAVDLAASMDGARLALVSPVLDGGTDFRSLVILDMGSLDFHNSCHFGDEGSFAAMQFETVATAYDSKGMLVMQSRSPLSLSFGTAEFLKFPGAEDRADAGHQTFHMPTASRIACASCHPEAEDDGHVWSFDGLGPRRTINLRGGILATAPFHWDGKEADMSQLMSEVFTQRMAGPELGPVQVDQVGRWLDAQRPRPRSQVTDAAAVARGQALFNDATVGCAACHSGPHFTDNQNHDVGTGGAFQVPSLLGVAARAPYMHTGCASTLRGRFDPTCGGGDSHGRTSQLSSQDLDDLVAYLKTL